MVTVDPVSIKKKVELALKRTGTSTPPVSELKLNRATSKVVASGATGCARTVGATSKAPRIAAIANMARRVRHTAAGGIGLRMSLRDTLPRTALLRAGRPKARFLKGVEAPLKGARRAPGAVAR